MEEEFYHKNIFGEEVDISFADPVEEKSPINKKQGYFPGFAFTDAIASRDKKEAWIQYQRELAAGLVAEQLFWSVTKQIKNLLLAKRTNSAAEADLNPFVYKKLKGSISNFKEGELEKLSESLVIGYHQARRGKGEIDMLIEKTLLRL